MNANGNALNCYGAYCLRPSAEDLGITRVMYRCIVGGFGFEISNHSKRGDLEKNAVSDLKLRVMAFLMS